MAYKEKVMRAAVEAFVTNPKWFKPGGMSHIMISHDDWCEYETWECNCNPEIEIISDEEFEQRLR